MNWIQAQKPSITMQQAVNIALKQNKQIQSKLLYEKMMQTMQSTAVDLPKAQINSDFANVNSAFFDSKIGLSQSFALPAVYKYQKALLSTIYAQAQSQTAIEKLLLAKLVKQAFVQVQLIHQYQLVIQNMKQLMEKYQQVAAVRFTKGETNLLEKTSIDNQVQQLSLQWEQLQSDEKIANLQLQLLLNDDGNWQISDSLKAEWHQLDTVLTNSHPYFLFQQQQQVGAQQQTQIEQSKLLPELTLGYTNQSFVGWLMDKNKKEQWYGGGNRFSSVQAGISVPIFAKAQKARVQVSKQNEMLVKNNSSYLKEQWNNKISQLLVQQQKNWQTILYYQKSAIPQANTIASTANNLYKNGEIGYVEWTNSIKNALAIQTQYADALATYQQTVIELHYYINDQQL